MSYASCIIGIHSELCIPSYGVELCSQSYESHIMSYGGLVHRLERSAYIRVVPGSTPGTLTTLVMHGEL